MPREVLNKLSLAEFCLKHGSMKFKLALEDALRPGLLHELSESGVYTSAVHEVASRVGKLLENADDLRAARDEAQRTRTRLRELPATKQDVDYGSGSFADGKSGGYDRVPESSLRKKLGLDQENQVKTPVAVKTVDLLELEEPKAVSPKRLKTLPPPPKKAQITQTRDPLLSGLGAKPVVRDSHATQSSSKCGFDLLDL